MKYKLICSDLDGTLLNSRSELSEENKEAVKLLLEKGVMLVPTTGRTLMELPACFFSEELFSYIIYSNGAGLYDIKRRENVFYSPISKEASAKIFPILKKYDSLYFLHDMGKCYISYDKIKMAEKYNLSRAYILLFNIIEKLDEEELYLMTQGQETEMICAMFESSEKRDKCCAELSEIGGLKITSSGLGSLEMISTEAGKGNAVRRFSEYISIPTDKIISVGDNKNDIEMLCAAGLGLAVSNGHEAVKAAADKVIISNDEHIAKYILENFID